MRLGIILISFMLAASALSEAEAQVVDYGKENGVFSFEEDMEEVTCSKRSAASISSQHSKLGEKSLKWEWSKEKASISINASVPYLPENPNPKETSVSSFVFWIYSPEPMEGRLRFSFMKEDRECCHFEYTLGFQGWRGAWVAFDRDMEGTPLPDMDRVLITAPEGVKSGCLYFDGIITASFQDVRYHTADWQARFINKETTNFWLTLNQYWDTSLDIPLPNEVKEQEHEDFRTIEQRFITLATEGVKPLDIDEIRRIYDSYDIRFNDDGTIKGKPIWFIRYGETYNNQGIHDAKQTFTRNGQTLKQLNDIMLRIAVSYMKETESAIKDEIAEIYVNLTKHLEDQGFAAGSGQGTLHHLGYSMRNFYTGPVIMKTVLEEAGLSAKMQAAMEWFSGAGEVKEAPKIPGMDVDAFNTSLMGRFAAILMLEDTPYKQTYMKALSRWVDNGFKYTEGLRPCFKRDGSVIHHRKCYPEYAIGGFKGSVNAIWMLAKTSFAISEQSHENQKKALLTMRFFSQLKSFPIAMSGRHPDGTKELVPYQFALLADAGSPDGTSPIDKELAEAYLRLDGTDGKWGRRFTEAGFRPEKTPEGGRYLGYGCSLSYRHEDCLVTFAGHSRYIWATETYRNENHYGRYLTHGSMQILYGSGSFGSGYHPEGWDWCHIPGTTAAERPMEEMRANVLNVDRFSGYEEMLLSDEWFAGGTVFGTEAAAYSMKLHEHDKYNGSLRARKSFFAFGNRIVSIGDGLENSLEGSELHTTIFQNSIREDYHTTQVNGTTHTEADYSEISTGGMTVLQDRNGTAYFVKDAEVHISRGLQHSFHEETDAPTEGMFEKAYIDHGGPCVSDMKAGCDRYEYLIVLKPSQEQMVGYAEKSPYTVLRADGMAHIVKDDESGIIGCAAFESIQVDDTILSLSPAVMMYRRNGSSITMTVSNPDLALYTGEADEEYYEDGKRVERSIYGRKWVDNPAMPTTIRIVLDGIWTPEEDCMCDMEASYTDGQTTLLINTLESRTETIRIKCKI